MATILPFTTRPTPPVVAARIHDSMPPRLPETGGRRGEYAIADVARQLSLLHLAPRTIVDKLRVLAAKAGMPLPRTPRVVRGLVVRGPHSICKGSRWDAAEIDAWLDNRPPTAPGAVAPRPIAPPIRDEMKRRARQVGAA